MIKPSLPCPSVVSTSNRKAQCLGHKNFLFQIWHRSQILAKHTIKASLHRTHRRPQRAFRQPQQKFMTKIFLFCMFDQGAFVGATKRGLGNTGKYRCVPGPQRFKYGRTLSALPRQPALSFPRSTFPSPCLSSLRTSILPPTVAMSLPPSKKAPSDSKAQCPDCGVILSRLADMNRHRKTKHPDGTETKYVGGTISTLSRLMICQ